MMQQNWWEAAPLANQPQAAPRPLIPAPPKQPTPQTPDQAALTQGQVQRLPLENEQTRASTASTIANMGQIPLQNDNTRTNIQQGQTSIRTSLQQAEQQLRDDFEKRPEVQNFRVVLPQYSSAIRAADNKAGDLQIVYAFSKVMDPGSVVRESETASAGSVGSVSDQVSGYLRSLSGGGRLPPDVRKQLLLEIRNRASGMADMYNQTRSQYEGLARQHGFNADAIIGPHPAIPYQQAEADFVGRPIKNGNGFTYPRGQQPPQAGQAQRPAPAQPFDPSGQGDIGFVNGGQAAALPPGAQEAKRDVDAQIAAGKLRSYAEIAAYTKQKYNFDAPNDPKLAAQIDDALSHGRPIVFNPPEWAKPNIDDARGHTDPNVNAVVGGITAGASGVPLTLDEIKAGGRGGTNSALLGADDWIRAGVNTLRDGQPFSSNFARERQIDQYDEQNNPGARLGGQVLGSLAMPTGAPGEAATAGRIALRSGLGREAANAAARRAFAGRIGREGAAAGGAYGFLNSDGSVGDRMEAGAIGAGAGGLGGFGLTRAGQALGRSVPRLPDLPPLVDPATGSLNQPLESGTAAQRYAAARQFGIDLPMDAAGDKTAAIIGKGFDISPASAGLMNDARRGTEEQVQAAAGNVAGRYGNGRTMADAGVAAQQGARNWITRAQGVKGDPENRGVLGKVYDAIPISDHAPATLDNTRATLQHLTNQFQSNSDLAETFRNADLERYRDALSKGGLSWQDLKGFRSRIGYELGEQRFSKDSPTRDQLKTLYGSLSEDMRATAAAHGPAALNRFERANNLNRNVEARIEGALVRILGDNSKNNPEAAAAAIQTIARSNRGSANIQQLAQIRASMAKGGEWGDVASSLIRLMGQPANSTGRDFNPETFVRSYADMSEDARNLLFGDRGRADLRKALDGFVAVNQRLSNVNALRNTSQTAPNASGRIATAMMSGTVAATLIHPLLGIEAAGAQALAGGANYSMAKLWTNPAFVRWATGYSRVAATGNRGAAASQIGRLQALAAREPSISQEILGMRDALTRAANDNLGHSVAASQPDKQQGQVNQ